MTEDETEALEAILLAHYDDEQDVHLYTTKGSMREALVKAFKLGQSSVPQKSE